MKLLLVSILFMPVLLCCKLRIRFILGERFIERITSEKGKIKSRDFLWDKFPDFYASVKTVTREDQPLLWRQVEAFYKTRKRYLKLNRF